MCGFGDASGPGFGSSWQQQGSPLILAEYGQWLVEVAETESSNWREMNCQKIRLIVVCGLGRYFGI